MRSRAEAKSEDAGRLCVIADTLAGRARAVKGREAKKL
jgi:hypothetical protein